MNRNPYFKARPNYGFNQQYKKPPINNPCLPPTPQTHSTAKIPPVQENFCSEKPILEFHGIQLYEDDLLILLLMYFLYKEKVEDSLLFLSLFALLFL